MKSRSLIIITFLLVAACGGDETATTTTVAAEVGAQTTNTTAAPTTTTEPPTTTAAPTTTTAECVVGTWDFDSAAFVESMVQSFGEEMPGEVSFAGGSYIIELAEDGTMTAVRDQWQFRFETAEGAIVNTIDGMDSGTYSVEGDTISVTTDVSETSVSVQAEVDGELVDLPFGGTQTIDYDTFSGSGSFDCDGDTMTVTFDGITSVLERI